MGKQSRNRKENRDKKRWVTATLIRFGESDDEGMIFTDHTKITLPDGTVMEKGISYNASEHRLGNLNVKDKDGNVLTSLGDFDVVSDQYGVYIYPKGCVWGYKE